MFLDGDIGEMDKHVVQFITAGIILDSAESTESKTVPTAYNRDNNMHIFLSTEKTIQLVSKQEE